MLQKMWQFSANVCHTEKNTYIFSQKTSEKYHCVKKINAIGKAEYPKTAGIYGTLRLCQLAGLWQSVASTRTYHKRETANKTERLRITCYDCRSSLYFYQHECKDTYYPYHYPVFIISIGFTCQHFLSLSVIICCCLSL